MCILIQLKKRRRHDIKYYEESPYLFNNLINLINNLIFLDLYQTKIKTKMSDILHVTLTLILIV
jgi:hypothetical protein